MKINYNRIRGGDYVEGICRHDPLYGRFLKGIVVMVSDKNQVHIVYNDKHSAPINFTDIFYYVHVCQTVFGSLEEAEKIMKARDPKGDKLEVYDRKYKAAKKDRYKIVHKIIR